MIPFVLMKKLPKVSPEVFPLNGPFAFLRCEYDVFWNGALFDNVDDSLSKMVELRRLWSEDFSNILYWWKISELLSSKFQVSSILSVFWRTQAPDQIHRLVQLHRNEFGYFRCSLVWYQVNILVGAVDAPALVYPLVCWS